MNIKTEVATVLKKATSKDSPAVILKIIVSFCMGILFSGNGFCHSFSPFAATLPCALDTMMSIASALGAMLGVFVFHSGISAFRYFSVVLVSTATLHICINFFSPERERLLRSLCPGFCSLIINCCFLFTQKTPTDIIVIALCESLICFLSVPVFRSAATLIFSKKFNPDLLREKQLVFCAITASLFCAQLRCLGVIGEMLCILLIFSMILFFALKKEPLQCAVVSVCCATAYAMNGNADFMSVAIAFFGIVAPLMRPKHNILVGLTGIGFCLIGCALGEYTDFFPAVPGAAVGCAALSFLPEKFFVSNPESKAGFSVDSFPVPVKAMEISKAVENLGDCVNAVRRTLSPIVTPKLTEILFNAGKRVCDKCEIRDSCINSIRNKSDPHYEKIASALSEHNLDLSCFPLNFENTCYCHKDMIFSMKQAYFIHCTNINCNNRISRFQQVTGNQLRSFGSLISSLCSTAVNSGAIFSSPSTACVECAEKMGIEIKSARLCKNQAGHEYFTLSFFKPKDNFNVTKLTENLCRDTGFSLDFPTLIQKDDMYSLIFKQKPSVSFKIAAAMKPATPEGVSGDYYRSFPDTYSRQIVLLSDGMGTGSRAAIDSAFTCEALCNLLKSGLDVKTSASAVNCAMLMKSTDESLATVDLLIADPILSTIKIYKCGAAPSFILKNGKTSILEAESAPMGILDNVDMVQSEISVSPGDIFLLVSDGVAQEHWGWIPGEMKSFRQESPTVIAKHILQCAVDRAMGKRPDDMTVIAVVVDKP